MFRIIAVAVLVVGALAACDDGATGPTATGGEVAFRLFDHHRYSDKWTGEGYIFATCENFLITPYNGVFRKLDIGFIPGLYPNPDVKICTS